MTQCDKGNNCQCGNACKIGMLIAGIIVLLFGIGVWPTMYRYDHLSVSGGTYPVRIHRCSGKTEILWGGEGWFAVAGKLSLDKKINTLPKDQLGKLEARFDFSSSGEIEAEIYNGTDRVINAIKVEVTVLSATGVQVLRRTYVLSPLGSGNPLTVSLFQARGGLQIQGGEKVSGKLVDAECRE